MRIGLAAFILCTTAFTPAFAVEIAANSKIDAVTVFPQGAEVTRIAEAKLEAGEHTLIFDGLPQELSPDTLRVEGSGDARIEIGSVDSRLISIPSVETDAARKRIEKQIEILGDERAQLDQAISDAEYQKSLMQQLVTTTLTSQPKEGETRVLGAEGLGGVLDLVSVKLAGFGKTILDARTRQREIDRQVEELHTQLAQLAPNESAKMRVTVHLIAPAATGGTFKLRYRVANAGWYPFYDARLGAPEKDGTAKIELVRRADVMQQTAESWDNVALTLSTARPIGATSAPDILPMSAAAFEEGRRENYTNRGQIGGADKSDTDAATLAPGEKAESLDDLRKRLDAVQIQAEVQVAGFQALYGIQGRVSIDNTGTAKKVRIATDAIDAKLTALAVPKLDPNAYLTAAFTLAGDTPLLPGAVLLYRDGVFIGQGSLPLLSPGEEAKLGFGADDLIKVKRIEVKRRVGEEGLISTSNVDERAFDITVKNLHDAVIPVTILDQMPYSADDKITVETLSGMTPPTTRDFERRRGVFAWSFDLEPQAVKEIKHGYKVSWPQDMTIGMNN